MASASKTPNLNLPQWVGTEKPERTDFNAAFDAIDTTVASHLASINSLAASLNSNAVTDMNNITEKFITFIVTASTLNTPAALDGLGFQITDGVYYVQFIIGLGANIMYHRTKYGNWTAWKQVTSTTM